MQKYSSVITIERFLIQNFANYRTMAEISTAKNRLPRSPTELEKDRPSFSSLVSLASACAMGDIAPLKSLKKKQNMKNSEVDMRVTCKAASCVGSNKNKKTTKLKSPEILLTTRTLFAVF